MRYYSVSSVSGGYSLLSVVYSFYLKDVQSNVLCTIETKLCSDRGSRDIMKWEWWMWCCYSWRWSRFVMCVLVGWATSKKCTLLVLCDFNVNMASMRDWVCHLPLFNVHRLWRWSLCVPSIDQAVLLNVRQVKWCWISAIFLGDAMCPGVLGTLELTQVFLFWQLVKSELELFADILWCCKSI